MVRKKVLVRKRDGQVRIIKSEIAENLKAPDSIPPENAGGKPGENRSEDELPDEEKMAGNRYPIDWK